MLMCCIFAIRVRDKGLRLWSVAIAITAKQFNKVLINNAEQENAVVARREYIAGLGKVAVREHGWIFM
jgi:hypothetical protein